MGWYVRALLFCVVSVFFPVQAMEESVSPPFFGKVPTHALDAMVFFTNAIFEPKSTQPQRIAAAQAIAQIAFQGKLEGKNYTDSPIPYGFRSLTPGREKEEIAIMEAALLSVGAVLFEDKTLRSYLHDQYTHEKTTHDEHKENCAYLIERGSISSIVTYGTDTSQEEAYSRLDDGKTHEILELGTGGYQAVFRVGIPGKLESLYDLAKVVALKASSYHLRGSEGKVVPLLQGLDLSQAKDRDERLSSIADHIEVCAYKKDTIFAELDAENKLGKAFLLGLGSYFDEQTLDLKILKAALREKGLEDQLDPVQFLLNRIIALNQGRLLFKQEKERRIRAFEETSKKIKDLGYYRSLMLKEFKDSSSIHIRNIESTQDLANTDSLISSIMDLVWIEKLTLDNVGIRNLPPTIGNLTQLEILDLGRNSFQTLPDSIGDLTQLRRLRLSDGQLKSLPEEAIKNLGRLTDLDVSHNKLGFLPESLGNLISLKTLDLGRNELSSVPVSIGNLSQLELLGLYTNKLKFLPSTITKLTNLNEDRGLNLRGNPLEPHGEDGNLGQKELKQTFNDRIWLD